MEASRCTGGVNSGGAEGQEIQDKKHHLQLKKVYFKAGRKQEKTVRHPYVDASAFLFYPVPLESAAIVVNRGDLTYNKRAIFSSPALRYGAPCPFFPGIS
jgi:hypothetical protein